MHMADALISPAVGGIAWLGAAGLILCSARKIERHDKEQLPPMMAVLAAFVFATQMINFAIPGTGSSGHLGGGLLLAILLGPHAAFLAIVSILTVQALFFADGGLLALGCNILNLGAIPCFIAYPLIYRPLAGSSGNRTRLALATMAAAIVGLGSGALAVVLETSFSGISQLPFASFVLLMIPIHLAIALVEGVVTAGAVNFLASARPGFLVSQASVEKIQESRRMLLLLLLITGLTVGVLSWFASERPDGLEWSIQKVAGNLEVEVGDWGKRLADIQAKTTLMPDYDFKKPEAVAKNDLVKPGTSLAGLLGTGITLLLAGGIGLLLQYRRRKCRE